MRAGAGLAVSVGEAVSFAVEWEASSFPYRFRVHVDSGGAGGASGGGGGASDLAGAGAGSVAAGAGAGVGFEAAAFFAAFAVAFFAAASGFFVFLIKLRTVSDGCAPLLIQCSIRSNFRVLFCPTFFGS